MEVRVQNESEQELKSENREFFFLIFRELARIQEFKKKFKKSVQGKMSHSKVTERLKRWSVFTLNYFIDKFKTRFGFKNNF